jgi:hypothetical protein
VAAIGAGFPFGASEPLGLFALGVSVVVAGLGAVLGRGAIEGRCAGFGGGGRELRCHGSF